ncbi:MAG TPA: hypothetical protein VFK38_03755 [Candidatus Limnocylindrales bacterium]|nr:hypothetical protein [Candidatus Limnocylindrales bacterium]
MKLLIAVLVVVVLLLGLLMLAGANLDDPGGSLLLAIDFLIPDDWGFLIDLIPLLLIIGLIGPVLSLLALYWLYVRATTRSGRPRWSEAEPRPVERDAEGAPIVPVNEPYCPRDWVVYPPGATVCEVDRGELLVRCPVDGTSRTAGQQLCRACGTRYVLGASNRALAVRRRSGPPEGGAAAA